MITCLVIFKLFIEAGNLATTTNNSLLDKLKMLVLTITIHHSV